MCFYTHRFVCFKITRFGLCLRLPPGGSPGNPRKGLDILECIGTKVSARVLTGAVLVVALLSCFQLAFSHVGVLREHFSLLFEM